MPESRLASKGPERDRAAVWLGLGLLLGLMLAFALYTGQVWEDFLITFRQSRNLALGHGLVYQVGERVQGFTSPLNVLVPAMAYRWWPQWDYVGPLWVFRLFGLAVLAGGFRYFLGASELRGGARWLFLALIAVQVKTVAFAMNGQEAALWIGLLAPAIACAVRGHGASWLPAGLCWAGLMWTRPDNPVYIAALAVGGLLFAREPRRAQWLGIAKAAALTTLLYGPWFCWAWSYYGSPVPHTITAKFGAIPAALDTAAVAARVGGVWLASIGRAFEPVYAEAGGWPAGLFFITRVLGAWCAFRWLGRGADPLRRVASWVFFCGSLYLTYVGSVGTMYPWYFPPLGCAAAVVLALDVQQAWRSAASRRLARGAVLGVSGAVLGCLATVGLLAFEQQRARQKWVEDGVREPIGRWLGEAIRPGDRVFLEPLGYIGYFSGAHMLDFPGLVSPSVVRARKERGNTYAAVISGLQPEWLVLRQQEFVLLAKSPEFASAYETVRTFKAPPEILAYVNFPGRNFIFADTWFVVLRRKAV